MPIYQITNDATGVTLELEGDREPNQEDINKAFSFAGKEKYPNAPVLQAPPSLYEQAKSVAPAFARVAAPLVFGAPMPQDVATIGRTMQQVTGGEPKQGMLEGTSRIDKEGIMALLSASPEKRELGASLGAKAADIARIVTPGLRAVPESVTRPAGEVAGQVAADLLSPMNLMTLGVAGAAGEATRIPRSVAAATESFAEATAPSAARAAQIADLTRAGEAARATEQVGKAIPAVLAPEVTRGAAESTGIALQTIADPEATPEQKLKASYEAAIGTLFAAGLGTQVARSFGMRGKGVTQADVLDNLASRKQTVGEAVGQVGGLIDQMDRIVPVGDLKTQFRELIARMNPDEPFIYRPEPIGEGPRAQVEGGRLPIGEVVEEAPETLKTQDQILAERLRSRDERIAAEEQKALEREAARAGTPLRTAEEAQAQRSAERQALRERAAAIRESIGRREFTAEDLMRGEAAPEPPIAEPVSRPLITPELAVERAAPREGGMLPTREVEIAPAPEGTALRSTEDILAERLRLRDERIAAEQEAAARTSTPIETVEQKLSRALASRDRRLAAEAVSETLESGAAQGEPTRVTRKKVEQAIGIGREEAGRPVAEQTIFNEVWNKALEETQGKFRQKAEGVAEKLEGLRTQVEPGVGANPFPQLMGAAWNGALSVAQAVIRAGGSIADGVAAGLRYAQQNFKEKFDEAEFSNELTRTIQRPSAVEAPPKMEPRSFAERVAAAPGVPPVIREAVAQSPRSSYFPQNVEQVVDQASVMTADQLNSDLRNSKSNTRVASGMELFNRYLNEGRTQEAIDLSLDLAKSGTTWGQLINQFKLLKSASREGVIQLVTKSMDERGRKITPDQAIKLGDSMDQYRGAVDAVKRAEIKLKDAVNKNDINGIKVNSGLLDMADALKSESDVALNEQIARLNPSTATDLFISMVQGAVMSPISIVRNLVGNTINIPLRELADVTASGIDMALSGNKNNSYNVRARTLDRIKAFGNSLPQAGKVLIKGADAMPYELGTDIGNPLNFQRAWRNLFDAMSGNYPDAPIARNLVEATLGAVPDVFLRLSQATDVPFKSADRARIISELGRQRGLSEAQIKLATRNPKLMEISDEASAAGQRGFTPDDLGLIEHESAKSVFQQENAATRFVGNINRFIKQEAGPLGYIPYRLISLFQKTPINVVAEAMQFTPAALFQGFNWKNLTPRQREIAVGRFVVGSVVGGAYAYLYDKGVITPNLDTPGETNKARELAKSGGVMPPGTLNVSGLRRLVRGENPEFKPGDTVKDLSALGTSGAIGLMVGTAKRLQERSPNDDPDFLSLGKGAALSGINFVMNQQFLKGTSDFIKLMSEESGNSLDRWIKNLAVTAASPVAPAILGVIRRSQREYLPAIGNEGFIKDTTNELNQRFAALGLQIPGTKDPNAMPVRRDLWGEPVRQTPKSENPWAYNLLSASKSREIDADPLNASIYSTWRRSADNKAIPSVPNPKITYGNKTYERLTPEQYDRYTQLVGFWRRSLAERAYLSGAYQQNGDDARIKLLNQAYDKGAEIGKYRFLKELRESGQTLTPIAARRGFQQPSE
jgi:hypothetical protein